jgi:hypothetical protein
MSTPLRSHPRRLRSTPRVRTPGTRPAPVTLTVTVLVGLLAVALGASGCSADRPVHRAATVSHDTAATTAASGPAPVTTQAAVATVVGRLPGVRRKAVRRQVTAVLDRWWDTAYVEGDYPRTDFGSFPGFTPGASRRARFDRDLTSNADIGARVDSVTPLMRKARLDVLAVGRRARSVTARFDLRMRVVLFDEGAGEGSAEQATRTRRLQARGRVFLTHRPAGWRIFGYDVTKGWLS